MYYLHLQADKFSNDDFLNEFNILISDLCTSFKHVIILGDFNLHFDQKSDPCIKRSLDLLNEHCLYQFVDKPTQKKGHILDWVVSNANNSLVKNVTVLDKQISDHVFILCELNIDKKENHKKEIVTRDLKHIDIAKFRSDIKSKLENFVIGNLSASIDEFNSLCSSVLDNHAPLKKKTVTCRSFAPWFSDEQKEAKRIKRQAERKWNRTKLQVHKDIYMYCKKKFYTSCELAKQIYFNDKFRNISSCKEMYQVTNKLFGTPQESKIPSNVPKSDLPNTFSEFFTNKIENIRKTFTSSVLTVSALEENVFKGIAFNKFKPVSEADIMEIMNDSSNKYCELDTLPTPLLKSSLQELCSVITSFVNLSLSSGDFPLSFKNSLVNPLLKNFALDQNDLKNYRPVSNLPFLSKILEKVVLKQTQSHLLLNHLGELFQSAYKKHHSTETALLKVYNDLLNGIDGGDICLLNLLDMSAAFDTIDHDILLNRLQTCFGFEGTVLSWFRSYLTNRSEKVKIENFYSTKKDVTYGVPQGSVLGPVLFTLYIQPLSKIFDNHNLNHHGYADDKQLYKTLSLININSELSNTETCVRDTKEWLAINKTKLNETKTEFIILGTPSSLKKLDKPTLMLDDTIILPSKKVKNLGVIFDENLSMNEQVSLLCQNMFVKMRHISLHRRYLTNEVTAQLLVSLVLSKMDYCNSLLTGLPKYLIDKLQKVQNCAAKICLKKRKFDHVTPLLKELHWLPVKERINYKIMSLCHKHFCGTLPLYLSDLLKTPQRTRTLRSANDPTRLVKPIKNLSTFGEKAFDHYAPQVWNELPREIRELENHSSFKRQLKTFLFKRAYNI